MKRLLTFVTVGLFLASYNSVNTSTPLTISTPFASVVPVCTATSTIKPTPTYNLDANEKGCDTFVATIPVKGTEGLSQEEIARKLFETHLEHYKSLDLGARCRLDFFKTVSTKSDQRIIFLAGEQKVDYVVWVTFSVKIPSTDITSGWVAGNGEVQSDGWIMNKALIIGITKMNDKYILKLIGTGP